MLKKILLSIVTLLIIGVASYLALYYQKLGQVCTAVVTPARSVITGACRYFSDPCHVPPVFYSEDLACEREVVFSHTSSQLDAPAEQLPFETIFQMIETNEMTLEQALPVSKSNIDIALGAEQIIQGVYDPSFGITSLSVGIPYQDEYIAIRLDKKLNIPNGSVIEAKIVTGAIERKESSLQPGLLHAAVKEFKVLYTPTDLEQKYSWICTPIRSYIEANLGSVDQMNCLDGLLPAYWYFSHKIALYVSGDRQVDDLCGDTIEGRILIDLRRGIIEKVYLTDSQRVCEAP